MEIVQRQRLLLEVVGALHPPASLPSGIYSRKQDGYELYNLRAGIRTQDDTWEIAAWCRNCTDERVVNSQFLIPFDGAIFFPHGTTWSHVGAPRVMGITGTYRF